MLALPLAVSGWLGAHWLMRLFSGAEHGGPVVDAAHEGLAPAHLCAACVMTLLLVVLLVGPALLLGYELAERLAVGPVPWWAAFAVSPPRPVWLAPELVRPPILATCQGERAPPGLVALR